MGAPALHPTGSGDAAGGRKPGVAQCGTGHRVIALHPRLIDTGPRRITDAAEWAQPPWLHDGFDALDWGLEITTEGGEQFSLTWDSPGPDGESIGLQPLSMLGGALLATSDAAIWEVGERTERWRGMVGGLVVGVELDYQPWDEAPGTYYCSHIALHGEQARVDIVLGGDDRGSLGGSGDDVAVLHPAGPSRRGRAEPGRTTRPLRGDRYRSH